MTRVALRGRFFAAVDGGFGAPLGGEEADCLADIKVEAEEVADYAPSAIPNRCSV